MSEPLIFNDMYGIKKGKTQDFVKASHEIVDLLTTRPTRHLYFAHCMNEEGTVYTNCQVHPDADSMVEHMNLVAEHIQGAGDYLDFTEGDEQLYGTPNETLLEQLAQWGTKINRPVAGFSRLGAEGQTTSVSAPLIFINSWALEEGGADDLKARLPEMFAVFEAEHPRILHHKFYFGDDGGRVTNVQVHPDAGSMQLQMQLSSDRIKEWQQLFDMSTMRIQLVGSPSNAVVEGIRRLTGPKVPLRIETPSAGFSRLA